MSDLPTRLRECASAADHHVERSRVLGMPGSFAHAFEFADRATVMRAAADEIERLREAALAALDAETPPTVPQVQALADAMWQVLDDMGTDSRSVCLATKAQARVAYEPFRFTDDSGDDGLDMPLAEAEAILAEVEPSPASSPIVKEEES